MSEILLAGGDQGTEEEKPPEKIQYKATQEDEELFFLVYHMNLQPSEVERMSENYRKWMIARFIKQKKAEEAMMQEHALMSQLGGNLRTH